LGGRSRVAQQIENELEWLHEVHKNALSAELASGGGGGCDDGSRVGTREGVGV
jgi:hypothetical protein